MPSGSGISRLQQSDPRFGTITEVQSAGVSNYNGLTISARHHFSSLQVQANYTWSHALDEISNAGFLQYAIATNQSILTPQDPFNLRAFNYGNADYDTRHYFSLNYVWRHRKYLDGKAFSQTGPCRARFLRAVDFPSP